jgi:hypothetical protein
MTPDDEHTITIKHGPGERRKAACSCGWRGDVRLCQRCAERDGLHHESDPDELIDLAAERTS